MSILTIRDLTHKFGGLTAISDLNLALEAHELVGVDRSERRREDNGL